MKVFTEFDKELARHIYKDYKWIARNVIGDLYLFTNKPFKKQFRWACKYNDTKMVFLPNHDVFKAIQWEDAEPTLIEDIYDPQILNETEKGYLQSVLRPFRDKCIYVIKLNDEGDMEFIAVGIDDNAIMYRFPSFKKGEKYVGMKSGHPYSLRELGITYD